MLERFRDRYPPSAVALILAAGISLALNLMVAGLVWAVVSGHSGYLFSDTGLVSENTTQILTGWGGGIIGVLGAYIGYAFGRRSNGHADAPEPLEPEKSDDKT